MDTKENGKGSILFLCNMYNWKQSSHGLRSEKRAYNNGDIILKVVLIY